MVHHSSYDTPRSQRSLSSGSSYSPGRSSHSKNRSGGRKPRRQGSWKDNPVLFNLICFVLPFLVFNGLLLFLATASPKVVLTVNDTKDYKTLDISFKIKSVLPLKSMTATIESQDLTLTKEKGTYYATISSNGVLEIKASGWNGLNSTVYEHIATLDDVPPTVDEDYTLENSILTIAVSDSQSGIDFPGIYGTDADGETVKPLSYDSEAGTVVFPMNTNNLVLYISDMVGNVIQPSYSSHIAGLENASGSQDDDETNSSSESSSTTETTAARETTKAAETTKARETTKAAETTKARETTKAAETTKARETTKAAETTRAKETTKAAETTAAAAAPTTAAPTTAAPTTAAPTTAALSPGGDSSSPTPGGSDENITILPLS